MSQRLPAEGPEREILLRALRDYSENCVEPELTPGCPYAVVTPTGRGCGEECIDILARYEAPAPFEEIRIGEFTIRQSRRARPRRFPQRAGKPFDAKECFLSEATSDVSVWKTVSLFWRLSELLTEPPGSESSTRGQHILKLYAELSRRGFDFDLVVREGLSSAIAAAIIASALVPRAISSEFREAIPAAPLGWEAALFGDKAPEDFALLVAHAIGDGRSN